MSFVHLHVHSEYSFLDGVCRLRDLVARSRVEYSTALLSSQTGYYGRSVYVEEARRKGIAVLPPDINRSLSGFTTEEGRIRVGLSLIKGLGWQSICEILRAREAEGDFTSLFDFCTRVNSRVINRMVLTNLIKVGAFDSLGISRRQALADLEGVLRLARREGKSRQAGQMSLWNLETLKEEPGNTRLQSSDYSEEEKLSLEAELLSISLREHPLKKYEPFFPQYGITKIQALKTDESRVAVAGMVINARRQPTRNHEYMLFLLLEDPSGQVEVVFSPRVYQQYLYEIHPEGIIVRGKTRFEGEQPWIIAESVQPLAGLGINSTSRQ